MADVSFDTSGWGAFQKALADMEERARDLTPVTKVAAATFDAMTQGAFEKSQSPMGQAWAPLEESTIAGRRKGSSKPLIDTGQLRISTFATGTAEGISFGVSGAAAQYAGAHQFGTTKAGIRHNVKIPARPFLPLDASGEVTFAAGPAREWLYRTQQRVWAWVLRGER